VVQSGHHLVVETDFEEERMFVVGDVASLET
jgi:hypothetical protein